MNDKFVLNIGHKIKAYRTANKLTQEQLAEIMGCSFKTISNIENDNVMPNIKQIINLCDVLHLSMDELFSEVLEKVKKKNEPDANLPDIYPDFIHRKPITPKFPAKHMEQLDLAKYRLEGLKINELRIILELVNSLINNRK